MTGWITSIKPKSAFPPKHIERPYPGRSANPLPRAQRDKQEPNGYAIVEKDTNKVRKAFATELHATAATHKAKDGSLYVHSTVKHYDATQRRWKKDHIPVVIKPFVFMEE